MFEIPAFEVRTPSGHVYEIYASGRTEGFGPDAIIINRIWVMLHESARINAAAIARLARIADG